MKRSNKIGVLATSALWATWVLPMGCSDYEVISMDGDDIFYQLEAGEVDVLLVVDNSCSMQPYQQKLGDNFDAFLTFFEEGDVDYQIGVATTSVIPMVYDSVYSCPQNQLDQIPEAGFLVGGSYITPDTPNGAALFSQMVNVGVCGNGFEMGLESAHRAFQEPAISAHGGFIREDAYLSVIFVSDEQDESPLAVNEYINAFREVKGQRSRDVFNASALVATNLAQCSQAQLNAGASAGTRYTDVATQTGGVVGNICDNDFANIVTELSLASSRLTDTFYLSSLPEASSLVVGVDGEEIGCDTGEWTYQLLDLDGQEVGAIVFDRFSMPPPQSKVVVNYDYGSGDPASFCGSSATDTGGVP
jgi:hypothetical protein